MDKSLVIPEKTAEQPEPTVGPTTKISLSTPYVESVHMTGERLMNAVLKNCQQQGGSRGALNE